MRIRALSVFEGIVYHCWCMDSSQPCRPTLEVDALLRPGDADATSGPLLLSVAEYITMAGGPEVAAPCLEQMTARGRIVDHLGVPHIAFPTWITVSDSARAEAPRGTTRGDHEGGPSPVPLASEGAARPSPEQQ